MAPPQGIKCILCFWGHIQIFFYHNSTRNLRMFLAEVTTQVRDDSHLYLAAPTIKISSYCVKAPVRCSSRVLMMIPGWFALVDVEVHPEACSSDADELFLKQPLSASTGEAIILFLESSSIECCFHLGVSEAWPSGDTTEWPSLFFPAQSSTNFLKSGCTGRA